MTTPSSSQSPPPSTMTTPKQPPTISAGEVGEDPSHRGRYRDLFREIFRDNDAIDLESQSFPPPFAKDDSLTYYVRKAWKGTTFGLLGCLLATGVIIGVNVGLEDTKDTMTNADRIASDFVNIFFPTVMIVFFVPIVAVSSFCEDAISLNFLSTLAIWIGTVGFLISAVFLEAAKRSQMWLFFASAALISCGAWVMFFCTLVTDGVEVMASAFLLGIGMTLIAMGSLSSLVVTTPSYAPFNSANSVLAGLVIVVLACVGFIWRLRKDMQRPLLKPANFMLWGVCSFGCGAFTQMWVAITSVAVWYDPDTGYSPNPQTPILAASFFFVGAFFMLQNSARVVLRIDALLEDRFPAITDVTPTLPSARSFWHANVLLAPACALALFGLIFAIEGTDGALVWILLIAFFFVALAFAFMTGAMWTALEASSGMRRPQKWRRASRFLAGFFIITLGFMLYFFSLILRLQNSHSELPVCATAMAVIVVGCVPVARELGVKLRVQTPPRIDLLGFIGLTLHPGHQMLAAFSFFIPVWCLFFLLGVLSAWDGLITDVSRASFERWGIVFLLEASMFLLLHARLARDIIESTTPSMVDELLLHSRANEKNNDIPAEDSKEGKEREEAEESEDDHQQEEEFEVVVVGGGPAGLCTAIELGRRGVKTVLLEQRADCIQDARYMFMNCATIEGLHTLGVDAKLKEFTESRGIIQDCPYGAIWSRNLLGTKGGVLASSNVPGRSVLEANLSSLPPEIAARAGLSPYASQMPIRMMQSQQERILRETAEAISCVSVRFSSEMKDFKLDDDCVAVAYARLTDAKDDAGGATAKLNKVRAKYLVACEGPGGMVAKKLGAKFDGFVNVAQTQSVMFRAPGLWEKMVRTLGFTHQYTATTSSGTLMVFVPVDPHRGIWNVPVLFPRPKPGTDMAAMVMDAIGDPTQEIQLLTSRPWFMNFFVAQTFRLGNGRVFLCGDSAHSWPPFGGIGGNTAFGDAHNLGWKLAACLKGWGGDDLLESYSTERRQHALRTALYVFSCMPQPKLLVQAARIVNDYPFMANLIRLKWEFANRGVHNHNHFAQDGVQLGIRYEHSQVCPREEIMGEDDAYCRYIPRVSNGARLPFFPLSSTASSIYDAIPLEGFALFTHLPTGTDAKTVKAMETVKLALASELAERGVPVRVYDLPGDVCAGLEGNFRVSASCFLSEALVLVRPDRIVAWHCTFEDLNELRDGNYDEIIPIHDIVNKVTGQATSTSLLDDAETRAFERWLLKTFHRIVAPLTNTFPNAVHVKGMTKEAAVGEAKSKKAVELVTTTKSAEGGAREAAVATNTNNNVASGGQPDVKRT